MTDYIETDDMKICAYCGAACPESELLVDGYWFCNEVHEATLDGARGRLEKIRLEDHVVDSVSQSGRLNPAWVALLMGFPADWTIPTSNGNAELRALGNAVVPQVAELLGRMIVEAEELKTWEETKAAL